MRYGGFQSNAFQRNAFQIKRTLLEQVVNAWVLLSHRRGSR